jgi:hypothetical protein
MSSFFVAITANGPNSPPKRLDYLPLANSRARFKYSFVLTEGVNWSSFV